MSGILQTHRFFDTPTVAEGPLSTGPLFSRYTNLRGISVVMKNGHYAVDRFPWQGDLDGLTEGVDYFMGGRSYEISPALYNALVADGFSANLRIVQTSGGIG